MRSNILLRSNSNYKPSLSSSLRRNIFSWVSLRWVFRRKLNPKPILFTSLPFSLYYYNFNFNPSCFPSRTKIIKPIRGPKKTRQNSFSSLFFLQRQLKTSIISIFFLVLNLQRPFILIDPDNFNPANPLVTPVHIQPEWYFLFAYAILRAVPNKLGGVIGLGLSILILFYLVTNPPLTQFNKISKKSQSVYILLSVFFFLTWLGIKPVEDPYVAIRIISTCIYFLWFIF